MFLFSLNETLLDLIYCVAVLDKNYKSSLLVGVVVRSKMNGKTVDDGAVVPTEKIHASNEIVPVEPPSSSVNNSTAIPESNPPSLINIPTSKFFSALDVDMRKTPPHAIMADVLKNLDIGGLQVVAFKVQLLNACKNVSWFFLEDSQNGSDQRRKHLLEKTKVW